jgi:hypothetical protein
LSTPYIPISPNKIEAEEIDYLYIENSQIPNAGMGLYTAIRIYKDEIISLFKGELLSDLEFTNRTNAGVDGYFMNMHDGTTLDCMHTACFAKYANDSEGFSKTNFKQNATITLDDDDNVCLVAIKNIKVGEEMFCSYGTAYWEKHAIALK